MSAPAPSARHRRLPPGAVPAEAYFVLGAVAQYAGAAVAIGLFDRVHPAAVAWLRVAFAAVIALAVTAAWRRRWTRDDVRRAVPFGVTLALMNLFFYLAIDRLPLGTAVAIEFIGPIAVAAWGSRSGRAVGSLALATLGVVLLSEISLRGDPLGLVYILLAAVMWAGYILLGHRFAGDGGGLAGLGLAMAVGAVAVAPVAIPVSGPAFADPAVLLLIALVGLLSNVVPYGLDQVVLRHLRPSRFALLLALLPVTATVVGALVLEQVPAPAEAVGIALVVAGIAVRDRREDAPVAVGEAEAP
jgi:inner membrane transporter RhtA